MRFTALVSLLCALLYPMPAAAQQSPQCPATDTTIYFSNGVLADEDDAIKSQIELQLALRARYGAADLGRIEFRLAVNTTGGVLEDLFESTLQDLASDAAQFWRIMAGIVPMPLTFRDRIVERVARLESSAIVSTQDMTNQLANYRSSLLAQRKVIAVAHSQGNFFANAAYSSLAQEPTLANHLQRFGVMAVASPDSFVARSGPHRRLAEDFVILAVSAIKEAAHLPGPLSVNVTNGGTTNDLSGHLFIPSYLAENGNSRQTIGDDITTLRASLPSCETVAQPRVVFARTGADETIQLDPPGGLRYYFLGYQSPGNPPIQPGYWTATQSFDVVRVRLLGGSGTCQDLGPALVSASRLIDEAGQTAATLVADVVASGAGYCVFRANVSAGTRIAAVELSPGLLSTNTFVLAGSSQNFGRSLFGFAGERAGGFAFQFCAGLCTEPLGTPIDTNLVYQQPFDSDPAWQTDQPGNFYWNGVDQTYFARAYTDAPITRPNRYGAIQLPVFDPNRGFTLTWDQRLVAVNGSAAVFFGLMSDDRLVLGSTPTGGPYLVPESTLALGVGRISVSEYTRFSIYVAGGQPVGGIGNLGGSGTHPPTFSVGVWYRFSIRYEPTLGQVTFTTVNRETNELMPYYNLTRAVPANAFSPNMRWLGVANDAIGVSQFGNALPTDYVDAEFDNVSLVYGAVAPAYTPTLSISPVIVAIGGSATLSWDTGGAPVSACTLTRSTIPITLTGTTGSVVIADIQGRTTFTLTCGSVSASRTIEVIPVVGGS